MPDGRIEPRQVVRLRKMGEFLNQCGESIYGTRGGPFPPDSWGASTHKDNKIYVHVLNWESDKLMLPPIKKRIVKNSILNGGVCFVKQTAEGIEISTREPNKKKIDTVIVLELDGPAADAMK